MRQLYTVQRKRILSSREFIAAQYASGQQRSTHLEVPGKRAVRLVLDLPCGQPAVPAPLKAV